MKCLGCDEYNYYENNCEPCQYKDNPTISKCFACDFYRDSNMDYNYRDDEDDKTSI